MLLNLRTDGSNERPSGINGTVRVGLQQCACHVGRAPFVAVVANLAQDQFMRMAASTGGLASVIPSAIGPALVRAVQMGYAEGYLAAKDD